MSNGQKQVDLGETVHKLYPLISRERYPEFRDNLKTAKYTIRGVEIGGDSPIVIAGPCAVQTREQTLEIADAVKAAGGDMLRGGAFKPRTSPYSFQGLGQKGLMILAEARDKTGLAIVTEVMDVRDVELVGSYADVLQIGSRNMQNYNLLEEVGTYLKDHPDKAVLLKNGMISTRDEILLAAEYLAKQGAEQVMICERGNRLSPWESKNEPNYRMVRELAKETYLPIIGDPSHSTGVIDKVIPAADEYLRAGVQGLIIEVRRDSEQPILDKKKVCDYKQSLPVSQFADYMRSHDIHHAKQK